MKDKESSQNKIKERKNKKKSMSLGRHGFLFMFKNKK
jgi:hypothetical protein